MAIPWISPAHNKDVQFTVTVDGTSSNTITLNGDYSGGGSNSANLELLRAALQSGINAALPNNPGYRGCR